MSVHAVELSAGATLIEPNRTRFRLWAPAREAVWLEVDDEPAVPMAKLEDGWFEAEAACGAGARYRYRLDERLVLPDPCARAQAGDVHGPSVVVDPRAYRWRAEPWRGRPWEEAVIYEAHVGLLGGFAGVAERLPELARLGVTAVELMPVADFAGGRNWGYDGVLPYAPDRAYGAPEDLKALVDRAHELGLMMLLDVVYNHFGPEGNYLAAYAPHFFRHDLDTPWGAAIDFRRPQVRRFFTENAIYWINEHRFDGLRLDAVHAIAGRDWLVEAAEAVRAAVEPGRCVHLVLENDDNDAELLTSGYDAQWNDDLHHVLHVLLTGETRGYYRDYADRPAERLARCLAQGFAYQGEPSAHRGGAPRGRPSGGLPPSRFVAFLQNHDQVGNRAFGERLARLADEAALQAATALLLLAPHIPLVFMGEEQDSRDPFLYFTDFHDGLAEAVREGRRREFESFPELAGAAQRARIPDPNDCATFERSRPRPGPHADQRRALYVWLLMIRAREIAPRLAGARSLGAEAVGPAGAAARWRLGDGALLTLAINLGKADAPFAAPASEPLHVTGGRPRRGGATLPGRTCAAWLELGSSDG